MSPTHPRFHYETRRRWFHGEANPTDATTLTEIRDWWIGDPDADPLDYPGSPSLFMAMHGFVTVRVCPGDGTDYWISLASLVGAGLPGRPVLAFSFLNTYRTAAALGEVDLNTGTGPWLYAHELGTVAAKLHIPSVEVDGGVCAAGHVATMLAGLACRSMRGLDR